MGGNGHLISVLIPRFRSLDVEMRRRDDFYALRKGDRDAWRLERLNACWAEALAGSAYYSTLAQEKLLPRSFESVEQFAQVVPVTQKASVRTDPAAFRLPGWRRGKWMLTGGSTGIPTRVFWGLDGHLQSLRDQYWARTWWGVQAFDRQVMLWGHSRSLGSGLRGLVGRMKVPVIDRLRNRRRFSAYRLDNDSLRRYYDTMVEFSPRSLYAYPSSAHLFALANEDRPPLSTPLKAAFLAGEPISRKCRSSVHKTFGCPTVGEYGSIECGMLAYEHPNGGYRVFEQGVLIETIPGNPGYPILVTQLRATGFPLFRYEIGDTADAPLCTDADGMEMIGHISGRTLAVLRSPSGRVCDGEAFDNDMEEIPRAGSYSVIQRRDYSLDIAIEASSLDQHHREWIVNQAQKLLGKDVEVRVHVVDRIQRTSAGKLTCIVSELA